MPAIKLCARTAKCELKDAKGFITALTAETLTPAIISFNLPAAVSAIICNSTIEKPVKYIPFSGIFKACKNAPAKLSFAAQSIVKVSDKLRFI
ncbi:MAG: hypothetical protein AMXMBFR48_03070 [Ignavibacteriales bacterium]